jgi:hypothetical protein
MFPRGATWELYMKLAVRSFITFATFGFLVLLVSFTLSGCDAEGVQEQRARFDTFEIAASEVLAQESVPAGAKVEAALMETAASDDKEVIINECLQCHVNQELLIDTADPVEEVISENEGEG